MVTKSLLHSSRLCVKSVTSTAVYFLFFFLLLAIPAASQPPTFPPAPPSPTTAPGPAPPPDSPTNQWTGCVDPVKGYQPVTIGETTTICLVLGNNGDWSTETTYMRLNFSPTADEYSRFYVPDSFTQLVGNPDADLTKIFSGDITVHAESQTALSFQKLYYNGSDKIFPFLTAIVSVNEGNVTGITWDNACVFCAEEECEDNTFGFNGQVATEEEAQQPVGACSIPKEECNEATETCDLMLYVVWTGTDSNGRDFMSSANRFSAFPKQSWSDRFNLALPDWVNSLNVFGNDNGDQTNN